MTKRKPKHREFIDDNMILVAILIVLLILILGAYWFHYAEGWSYFNALYFTIITMSTIWYGDIVPLTQLWRSLAMIFAFLGVPMFIALSGVILENRFRKIMQHHLFEYNRAIKKTQWEIKETQEDLEDISHEFKKVEKVMKEDSKKAETTEKDMRSIKRSLKEMQKRRGFFKWSFARLSNKIKK